MFRPPPAFTAKLKPARAGCSESSTELKRNKRPTPAKSPSKTHNVLDATEYATPNLERSRLGEKTAKSSSEFDDDRCCAKRTIVTSRTKGHGVSFFKIQVAHCFPFGCSVPFVQDGMDTVLRLFCDLYVELPEPTESWMKFDISFKEKLLVNDRYWEMLDEGCFDDQPTLTRGRWRASQRKATPDCVLSRDSFRKSLKFRESARLSLPFPSLSRSFPPLHSVRTMRITLCHMENNINNNTHNTTHTHTNITKQTEGWFGLNPPNGFGFFKRFFCCPQDSLSLLLRTHPSARARHQFCGQEYVRFNSLRDVVVVRFITCERIALDKGAKVLIS